MRCGEAKWTVQSTRDRSVQELHIITMKYTHGPYDAVIVCSYSVSMGFRSCRSKTALMISSKSKSKEIKQRIFRSSRKQPSGPSANVWKWTKRCVVTRESTPEAMHSEGRRMVLRQDCQSGRSSGKIWT